jgi:hypothetical protein
VAAGAAVLVGLLAAVRAVLGALGQGQHSPASREPDLETAVVSFVLKTVFKRPMCMALVARHSRH